MMGVDGSKGTNVVSAEAKTGESSTTVPTDCLCFFYVKS